MELMNVCCWLQSHAGVLIALLDVLHIISNRSSLLLQQQLGSMSKVCKAALQIVTVGRKVSKAGDPKGGTKHTPNSRNAHLVVHSAGSRSGSLST